MVWVWRLLGALVAVAVVLGVVAVGFGWWSVQRSWPQTSGTIEVAGLGGSVEVLRDERGIPNIYADNPADLFFAHGYVHAQDRFWEMDVRRHITAGRLSEMFGEDQYDTDVFLRTLGWRRVAEQEFDLLSQRSQAVLRSYAAGVNAYLAGRSSADISLEYQVLSLQNADYRIEPWHPIDSLAWLKALAWDLRGNMDAEVQRALSAAEVGTARVEQLFPPYPQERNGTILSDAALAAAGLPTSGTQTPAQAAALVGEPARAALRQVQTRTSRLEQVLAPAGEGIGSNSWVVSGRFTQTGKPLLANDPHLAPSMPSLWYQAGLHCTTVTPQCPYDVSGFTLSGLPGVIIGHNNRIAWGLTNLGPDVTDLVLEQIDGDAYIVDGQRLPLQTRTETIRIAGGSDRQITVRSTGHGPLVSDTAADEALPQTGVVAPVPAPGQQPPATVPERAAGYAVALRWTALRPTPVFDAIDTIGTAGNWDEFRAAARLFSAPAQNLIYADVDGNIGYQAPGDVPIRRGYDGKWPVPGWDSAYDWVGSIPFDQLPRSLNPPEGLITTANHRVVPAGYPWQLQTDEYSYGARAKRINERLADAIAIGALTSAQMAEIQLDAGNDLAGFLAPQLGSVPGLDEAAARAAASLADWDLQQTVDSRQAAFFNVFYRQLIDRLFSDELPDIDVAANAGDRSWEVIRQLWDAPADPWWDDTRTPGIEGRDETVADALNAAAQELASLQGDDPADWHWGSLHTLTFTHQTLGTSGIGVIERIFNRGPEPTAGGGSIPLATGWEPAEGYEVTWVPSMRQVVDLADFDASTWVNLTGNSGHAYHDNYGDQIRAWLAGDQYPWQSTRPAVEAVSQHRLVLEPAGG